MYSIHIAKLYSTSKAGNIFGLLVFRNKVSLLGLKTFLENGLLLRSIQIKGETFLWLA